MIYVNKKGIKREYSVAKTPQQNGIAERRNKTLIGEARTILADSKLAIIFWAEAVNTACYVQNRVLLVKPHFKIPYELFRGSTPAFSFTRPFRCHVTILNTLDHLGKFDRKSDEGFFFGYSTNSRDIFVAYFAYRILDNREIELNVIVDCQVKTITEASVRRHLKLADADGISTLPITEIFEQLALMGNMKRESKGFSGVETTLFSTVLVTKQVSQGEGPTSPVGTQHTPTIIKSSPQLQNISITYRKTRTKTRRMDIRIPQSNVPSSAADEAITKEMHDGLGRATNTASSLGAEQGSGNISKTQTKATPSGPSSPRTSSKGGPGCHFTMRDSLVQARPERLSNLPNEPPLKEVTHLENELTSTKGIYNKALITLTKRVKKLEKKLKYRRRREVIDSSKDKEASLDHKYSPKQGRVIENFDKDVNVNLVKSSEQGEDEEYAQQVQDQWITNKASLAQENLAQAEQWDDVQAQIQADEHLAQRMLEEEKESLSIEERSRLLAEFIDKRKKMMAAKRAKEKRNKPPSQAQQRTYISNYLKNIRGESLKISAEEELGQEQKVKEEIAQQEDVVAKQAEKESSKKAGGRLKRKTLKAREDKDKRHED
uniref:Ribonuclease H-like domain-containing protein n=1 Tax=Tanacetum cinerariifolium TaxID=118510 RepID=A0A6L2LP20_TANCI|nr:ribonuclease H-like domain-containing protein [Tanacetum cinerariifolium]